jgi:hypothetical protein
VPEPLFKALRKPPFFSPDEFIELGGVVSAFGFLDNNLDTDCIDCCFLRG